MRLINTILLCGLLLLQSAMCVSAQKQIKIKFKITDEDFNILKGARVVLYCENEVEQVIESAPSSIKMFLESGHYYTLEVSLPGFITKRIIFRTDIDEQYITDDDYKFEIGLERAAKYRKFQNPDRVLEYPIAIIEMDTVEGRFDYNEKYYKSTRQDYEQLLKSIREINF
ncbi:MAG: hypothetical protein Kow0075_16430 [Salibacteraceae bacterium]